MTVRWALTLVRLKNGNLRSCCSDSGRRPPREGAQYTAISVARSQTGGETLVCCVSALQGVFQRPGILLRETPVCSAWDARCKAQVSGSLLLLNGVRERDNPEGKTAQYFQQRARMILIAEATWHFSPPLSTRWCLADKGRVWPGVPGSILPHPGPGTCFNASLWAWPSCFPSQGLVGLKYKFSGFYLPSYETGLWSRMQFSQDLWVLLSYK